jgi:hypothetical protein
MDDQDMLLFVQEYNALLERYGTRMHIHISSYSECEVTPYFLVGDSKYFPEQVEKEWA